MRTLIDNEEPNLTSQDAKEYLGSNVLLFQDRLVAGQRIGQAWYNSLTLGDQNKLNGSYFDPFHADAWPAVIKALRFLLEN